MSLALRHGPCGSHALLLLEAAYERLGLDPFASTAEKPTIWEIVNKNKLALGLLSEEERDALAIVVRQKKTEKMNGGECFEPIRICPAEQIRIMTEWRTHILEWVSLPIAVQRSPSSQLMGKRAKNAFSSKRQRDAWKGRCAAWLQETEQCVSFASDHFDVLWRSDAICHHALHELVLAAPKTLTPRLAEVLPFANNVPGGCTRQSQQWAAFERAVVCVLRSRHSEACAMIASRIFYDGWQLSADSPKAHLRLASHAVRFAIPAGEQLLQAWMEASPMLLKRLLRHPQGLCALKASLSTDTTFEYLPALFRMQKALAVRLEQLRTSDDLIAACLGGSEKRRNKKNMGRTVCEMIRVLVQEETHDDAAGVDIMVWDAPRGVAQAVENFLAKREVETDHEVPQEETLPRSCLRTIVPDGRKAETSTTKEKKTPESRLELPSLVSKAWSAPQQPSGNYSLQVTGYEEDVGVCRSLTTFCHKAPAVEQISTQPHCGLAPSPAPLMTAGVPLQNGSYFPAFQAVWVILAPPQSYHYYGNAVQAFPCSFCYSMCGPCV